MSNRSEDEVSSVDKVEFQDSGFDVRRQDSLDNVGKPDKDLATNISSKQLEGTDILQPPRNSTDKSRNEDASPKIMPIVSTGTLEHQDDVLSYGKDSEDGNAFAIDVVPIKTETLTGVSEESREVGNGPSAAEFSVEQRTDSNGNEEGEVNGNLSDNLILPSEHAAGEVSKTEEFSDRLDSKTSMNETVKQEETNGNVSPRMDLERNVTDIFNRMVRMLV
ncbi:uncharacterized protein LOC120201962 [Hibiscus syriacus]|uniref:uncharacterized protein LOC120201962 n=1 Tax=Hibiscus syriacus TaxID=106335 RepID=UPI00192448FD|nr:uncharacterized protein LOC120201962 [Hibiscus syriacus]